MSILRPACYKKFADVIQSVYDRFERGTGAPKQDIQILPELESFLTGLIRSAMGEKAGADLTPSTDLFSYGVDSLTATRVRNDILKQLELGDAKLGQNIVYEHPSISQLAQYILDAKQGRTGQARDVRQLMVDYVDKWSKQLVQPNPGSAPASEGQVIVLTGATGSLGAHILDQLTRRPEVAKVICLSRAKSHADSEKRLADSLAQRQRNLSPEARAKVVSYASDVNRPDLGLSPKEYASVRDNLTSVIHNAWPVNFVLSLESYDEHIGGAVNLINLARSSPRAGTASPPSFFFSSSVATVGGRPDTDVYERFSDSAMTANATGYGQSKWVVEKIVERAEVDRPGALRMGVFRIGQLAGDTENGVWNETEAWPLMFRAALTTGTLPDLEERPTWLPVDLAGRGISDVALAARTSQSAELYHILSNKPTMWRDILAGLKKGGLEFTAVDRFKWLENLAASEQDVVKNPTYKLLVSLLQLSNGSR
jgi:thioester reductase-like protein